MEKSELLETLKRLDTELDHTEEVDPQTRDVLRNLAADIRRLLDEGEEIPEEQREPVSHGLHDALLKFESDHPQLSAIVGQIADGLARMGI